MSYDLLNPYIRISRKFSRQFWCKALDLAELYGWQPAGTHPPFIHDFDELNVEWDGNYLTNDGQIVDADDASGIAAALEKALSDVPDAKARMDWNLSSWVENDLPEWLSPDEKEMLEDGTENELLDLIDTPPLEYFAGDEKYHLKQFVRFCRLGDFIVM